VCLMLLLPKWTSHQDHHPLHQGCGRFPFSKPSQ
jgi:hypothetical protein